MKWYSTPSPNLSPYIFLGLDPSPPPLLIGTCGTSHVCVWAWLTLMCVNRHIHVHTSDMTHLHVCHYSFNMQYVWKHDSWIRVAWLMDTCDMTHGYVWRDSWIRVTWLMDMCDMTHGYVWNVSSSTPAVHCALPLPCLQLSLQICPVWKPAQYTTHKHTNTHTNTHTYIYTHTHTHISMDKEKWCCRKTRKISPFFGSI